MTTNSDPRPAYRSALAWAQEKVRGVDPAMLDRPTPCSEYDVRALLGHLVATVVRARVIAEGGDPTTMPVVITGVPDDGWAAELAAADRQGDGGLVRRRGARPGGHRAVGPGARAAGHLGLPQRGARARLGPRRRHRAAQRGRPRRSPRRAWPRDRQILPATFRGGPVPFAEVVTSAPDAGPTERLANWAGHRR